ncbi:MAG: histidinol-phosphatase HisJ family protein [Lachnospiraceae bacterium]|nr:histidinol-phosphatase HisJ family protein [Lachnospiraceae bacterium]
MYSDSHCHTSFSSDSDTAPRAQIERAIALDMRHLTITDHYDPDFPSEELDFLFDADEYFLRMGALREEVADRLALGLGVELGLQPHLTGELPAFAASHPFDFIIGSTHVSRHLDPYEADLFFRGLSEEEAYRLYFEEELDNLKLFDCYDVAGHLDYVVRYGPTRNAGYTWERYGDILEEILRTIIDKGKGIECNTAGLNAGLGVPHPMPEVLRRYRELGGEILTLGSDAHTPERLGAHFAQAGELLKSLGFRYYTVFRERKPTFYPL